MKLNQTNANADLKAKLMPLFHAIESEIVSQAMKNPDFKYDFKTVVGNCRIEVNFPHLTGASASHAKQVQPDHAAAIDAAARSAGSGFNIPDAQRAGMQATFDAQPKKIPKL